MQPPKTATIVLDGTIPSKKNSRINLKSGVSIPSKDFATWQKSAIVDVRRQTRARFYKPVAMEVLLYFGDLGIADTDNKLSSIMDMLVEALVFPGDHWQIAAATTLQAAYRPRQPGAFIRITELEPGYFGPEYDAARAKLDARKKSKLNHLC